MEIRFCKNYLFDNKVFTNFEFDDNARDITFMSLRAKEHFWKEILHFRDVSLDEVLADIGIPNEVAGNFNINNVTFKKGSTIDFGLGDYSYPNVNDFIEGRTSELVLDIKEI